MATPPLSDELARAALTAWERFNHSHKIAAKELGIPEGTFNSRLEIAKKRGLSTATGAKETLQGYNPDYGLTHSVPEPLVLRGTSTLYDKEGGVKLQWIKTKLSDELVEKAMLAAIEALAENVVREKPVLPPAYTNSSLCNVYTLTDCHVGAKIWIKENLEANWDLKIAEDILTRAFDYPIEASPSAQTCVIAQIGDFLNQDSLIAQTPTGLNPVDSDGRYSKVVQIAVKILRYVVSKSLEKHEKVIILMAEGNHDLASSVWLRHLFSILYENEPRVEVIDSELPYYVYKHGATMLSWHHGHLKKNDALPLLFAAQFPVMWGETTKRYCHTGHRHHSEEKEHSGMKVTQHSTLVARDSYASRNGWMAEREIRSFTYHSMWGQVATNTVTPEMLE